jgi:hypothetical protein
VPILANGKIHEATLLEARLACSARSRVPAHTIECRLTRCQDEAGSDGLRRGKRRMDRTSDARSP